MTEFFWDYLGRLQRDDNDNSDNNNSGNNNNDNKSDNKDKNSHHFQLRWPKKFGSSWEGSRVMTMIKVTTTMTTRVITIITRTTKTLTPIVFILDV